MECSGTSVARLAVLAVSRGPASLCGEVVVPDDAFVNDYCASCHNDVSKKGRLDLTGLAFDPSDSANLAVWIKVHDRVKAGEMPPRNRAPARRDPAESLRRGPGAVDRRRGAGGPGRRRPGDSASAQSP